MNVSVRAALQAREERAGRAREGRAARTADVPTENAYLYVLFTKSFLLCCEPVYFFFFAFVSTKRKVDCSSPSNLSIYGASSFYLLVC